MQKHEITIEVTISINGEEVTSNLKINGMTHYAHLLHLVCTLKKVTERLEYSLSQMPLEHKGIEEITVDELYQIANKIKLPSEL